MYFLKLIIFEKKKKYVYTIIENVNRFKICTECRKKPIRSLHFKEANTICAVRIRVRLCGCLAQSVGLLLRTELCVIITVITVDRFFWILSLFFYLGHVFVNIVPTRTSTNVLVFVCLKRITRVTVVWLSSHTTTLRTDLRGSQTFFLFVCRYCRCR